MPTPHKKIDWQGHRGCRGLMPENTIPAFIHALQYSVTTLELDVAVSKDGQIIVTHEPWFNHVFTTLPNGETLKKEDEEKHLIYELTYEEIKQYDCGLRSNPKYPKQSSIATHKPSFKDMVVAVDAHCKKNKLPLPNYDIEVKSYKDWYGKKQPFPKDFVRIMLSEIKELGIKNRINLQSFDVEVLLEVNRQDPTIVQAYLIDNLKSFETNLEKLDFVPEIYSPYFKLITPKMVEKVHTKGMKLIPWTVNELSDMKKVIQLGVDGIITDYPDRISEISNF